MEYLRNVGIRGVKPDTHIMRICGPDRLSIIQETSVPCKVVRDMEEFAERAGLNLCGQSVLDIRR